MNSIYLIIGSCGTGKTWVMKEILNQLEGLERRKMGLYHFVKNDTVAILGVYDGDVFDGSDRLSMSIMKDNNLVKDIFSQTEFVIGEGDRFTNSTFIEMFKPIILKICGDGVAGRRMRGSDQSDRHIKSIATRVSNIKADVEFVNSNDCFRYLLNVIKKTGIEIEFEKPRITGQQNILF